MKTKTINVYQFSELSDSAKQKALDWYRSADDFTFDSECILDDAKETALLLGIDIDKIYYSGFSSQGDGASFIGSYKYKKNTLPEVKAMFPNNAELQRIAKALQDVQRKNFYRLTANVSHRGHYYHSGCMVVSVEDSNNQYRDIGSAEDDVTQALRDFADWIYSNLEKQYEWVNQDEQVEENILANEYEFDENGQPI